MLPCLPRAAPAPRGSIGQQPGQHLPITGKERVAPDMAALITDAMIAT